MWHIIFRCQVFDHVVQSHANDSRISMEGGDIEGGDSEVGALPLAKGEGTQCGCHETGTEDPYVVEEIAHAAILQDDRPPILRLPKKLLTKLLDSIECPRQQVLFSLTCSKMLLAAEPIMMKTCTIHSTRVCNKMQLLRDLRSVMPAHLHLCRNCLKYVPRYKIWRTWDGTMLRDLPLKIDWLWVVRDWVRTSAHM